MPKQETVAAYVQNAIEWAKALLGSDAYQFRCLAFVEDALEQSNHIEIFGGSSAKESADWYAVSENRAEPPAGAFVFYDCTGPIDGQSKNWGHVGLCMGNGEVIHAWGSVRIDPYLAVEQLSPAPGWNQPRLIGWAPIETVLKGYHDHTEKN